MSQVSGTSATADGRSVRRVLRPAFVLGGFVAVWWALTTGVAHADASPHGLANSVRHALTAHHTSHSSHASPVRDMARRAHHDVKPTATKVAPHVRHEASPVHRTVSAVVDSTPVAPTKTEVTRTVRTVVDDTVTKTRSVLARTAAGPVVDDVDNAMKQAVEKRESSTGQGNSRSTRGAVKAPAHLFTDLLSVALGQQSSPSAATHQQWASMKADLPLDGTGDTPPVHDPCTSPEGSGSTSFTPVGVDESSLLVMPSVLGDLPTWRLARQPGGPAYQPGCSPD